MAASSTKPGGQPALRKDTKGKKAEGEEEGGEAEEESSQRPQSGKKWKPDPFAKERKLWEERQRQLEEEQKAHEDRRQRRRDQILARRKKSAKFMQRTARGQPIMKNVLQGLLSKLEKPPQ